jgi:uncharacterized protein (TIGR00369 family)
MDLPAALQFTPPAPTLLGREILELDREAGAARMRFLAREEFTNRHGSVQGGFVAAMLDSATSVALIGSLPDHLTSVTMRLETEYLKPTPVGSLIAVAEVVERSEREATVNGVLQNEQGVVFARATAVLRIRPRG